MAVFSVRDTSYSIAKKKNKSNITAVHATTDINDIIKTIVNFLLTYKAPLIIEIEKGNRKRVELEDAISEYIKKQNVIIDNLDSYQSVVTAVYDYIFGYRIIQPYIERRDISDIAIKGINDSWIKVNGRRNKIDLKFDDNKEIFTFASAIAVKNKAILTKANALVRFADSKSSRDFNLRINIGIEPVNTVCPHIVIRKIPKWHIKPQMDDLLKLDMFNEEIMEYVIALYKYGMNPGIYGEGGSGKSTLLNAAIEYIPEFNSKLCIQEVEELSSGQGNWIWENVVMKEGEGDVEYNLQKLAENGLVLDLDNFIISESKGAESMSLFEALFTRHAVSFTAHAPDEENGNERVALNMKKSGTDYTRVDLLRMLSFMDVSILMEDFKVKGISEITGFDDQSNRITYNPVFKYENNHFVRVNESCERFKKKMSLQMNRYKKRLDTKVIA